VDTANLPARSAFMGAGPNLHLIEKFTRVSDKRLDYQVTLDPTSTAIRKSSSLRAMRATARS